MNAITRISSKGQVVIPKKVREALALRPGQALTVSQTADGVLLRPFAEKSGRSFDEIDTHLRSIVKYDGPTVSIEEMNETIAKCWEESARRSDARD